MDQFIVSARKYRPDTFSSVVGQETITTTLKNAIRSGHIAQSFLFCGPRGVGKTTCARILAKTINCQNLSPEIEPCGECESCKGFQNNASQNIFELDAASNNSVEDIRSLTASVGTAPQVGKYKVYIIDEVHMLSTAAFNAFLKTLEEPPAYAKFILATTERHKIMPTILSRCQISDFKRITANDIVKHLQYISKNENVEAEEEALSLIAQKADGGLRDALSLYDQVVTFSNSKLTYKDITSLLNILDHDTYFRFTEALLEGNHSVLLNEFNDILQNGFEALNFVNGLNSHFRQLLIASDKRTLPLLDMSQDLANRYFEQSQRCNANNLLFSMDLCSRCDLEYRSSSNKRLLVEILILQICAVFGSTVFPTVADETEVEEQSLKSATEKDLLQSEDAGAAAQAVAGAAKSVGTASGTLANQSANSKDGSASQATLSVGSATPPSTSANLGSAQAKPLSMKKALEAKRKQIDKEQEIRENATSISKEEFLGLDQSILDEKLNNLIKRTASSTTAAAQVINSALGGSELKIEDGYLVLWATSEINSIHLQDNKRHLCKFFREELSYNALELEIKVNKEYKPGKIIYTAHDKFMAMYSKNPVLAELKSRLLCDIEL